MSKVAHYLQEHLLGEVTSSPEVRLHFAKDASMLRMVPQIVAYPRNESDVRKTARFAWQLAERGKVMPITARGGGSDTSGAAIGSGIILVFTAHLNRILSLDPRKQTVVVEPGLIYDKLEQTLYTHGLFLPAYPSSKHYATIGGSIANNAIGEKTLKYGSTGDFVQSMRVVLANGEVIQTGKISKRELNRKMGMSTMEGEIYRQLDGLLEENAALIDEAKKRWKGIRNAAGYNIFDIKKGADFDLTPLFIGSQGTLGIITEAEMITVPHNPLVKMALVSLENLKDLDDVLPKIMELKPSILDFINQSALYQVSRNNPNQLKGLLQAPGAAVHLMVEFDDDKDAAQKRSLKKLSRIIEAGGGHLFIADNPEDQDKIWKVRQSIATLFMQSKGQAKAVPVAEDISVPAGSLAEFLHQAGEIYGSVGMVAAAWGHAGDGVVRMHPVLDLGQVGDRQKLFKLTNGIYGAALKLGGSITAASGDGRVRAPYTATQYGRELHGLMLRVKQVFDPLGILNPGVKTASVKEIKELMRGDYGLDHRHEYLPRS
jgi:FAD/FMN-containing dehydrogenase